MLRRALITIVLPAVLLVSTGQANAGAIDFRVGQDMAELSYLTQTASFGYGGADIGFGAMVNEFNDFIASGSILVSGSAAGDVQGLHFGVGAKGYGGSLEGPGNTSLDITGGAIAIGGKIRYILPGSTPLAILAEGFYAPEVTSIAEFDGLVEYRFALELEVTPSARAYIGYRNLEVTFRNDIDYEVDDAAHVGVRFEF